MPEDAQGEPATEPATPTDVSADTPKPTETVEFWKQKSREQEARAKANADAARELADIRESQKTEAQKNADATAAAQAEAVNAKAEALAYRLAATHGVTPNNFDLLGVGDEEQITDRAARIGGFLKLETENTQLRAELDALKAGRPIPNSNRPVADLKPGATPTAGMSESDKIYADLFGA